MTPQQYKELRVLTRGGVVEAIVIPLLILTTAHARNLTLSLVPVPDREDMPGRRWFVATLCDHSKPEHEACWSSEAGTVGDVLKAAGKYLGPL